MIAKPAFVLTKYVSISQGVILTATGDFKPRPTPLRAMSCSRIYVGPLKQRYVGILRNAWICARADGMIIWASSMVPFNHPEGKGFPWAGSCRSRFRFGGDVYALDGFIHFWGGSRGWVAALFAHIRVPSLMELPFGLVGTSIEPLVTR